MKDKEYAEKEHNHACNSRKTPIYCFKDLISLEDRPEFLQKLWYTASYGAELNPLPLQYKWDYVMKKPLILNKNTV